MKPGDKLANGTILVAQRVKDEKEYVVLAIKHGPHPYATWRCNRDDLATFSGNYFKDINEAVYDYRTR